MVWQTVIMGYIGPLVVKVFVNHFYSYQNVGQVGWKLLEGKVTVDHHKEVVTQEDRNLWRGTSCQGVFVQEIRSELGQVMTPRPRQLVEIDVFRSHNVWICRPTRFGPGRVLTVPGPLSGRFIHCGYGIHQSPPTDAGVESLLDPVRFLHKNSPWQLVPRHRLRSSCVTTSLWCSTVTFEQFSGYCNLLTTCTNVTRYINYHSQTMIRNNESFPSDYFKLLNQFFQPHRKSLDERKCPWMWTMQQQKMR